jgi:hypothetical protein
VGGVVCRKNADRIFKPAKFWQLKICWVQAMRWKIMPRKTELDKAGKIKKEKGRLNRVFKTLDKNKLATVQSLINTAAFIAVTLDELQEIINTEGYISEYKNGANQYGKKQSEAVEIHIAMTRNLTTIIKQLSDLAPTVKRKDSKLDALRRE